LKGIGLHALGTGAFLLFSQLAQADCVILLHGLARTAAAMEELEERFTEEGYTVVNAGYPSREYSIEELAPMAVEAGLEACPEDATVHFVTHSLGGILVRQYLVDNDLPRLGRVVMLAPPNQGSEVVDKMRDVPGFRLLNGPAGLQLGTGPDDLPRQLPPVDFPLGVIAGTRTFNLMLSQFLPNPDDGKVSVESTKVEGMTDFITVPYSHPFIMERDEAIDLALRFIQTGSFAEP
jgi:pimeloyl-ACP methyl ester carboxylesterase